MEAAENDQNRSLQNVVGFLRLELSRGRIRSAEAIIHSGIRPAGAVQRGGGEIRVTASIERGKTCPAGAIEHGKIRVPCMIRGVRAVKRALSRQDIRAVYPPTALCRAF